MISSLRERIQKYTEAFRNVPRAFGLLWQADPKSTFWMSALTLVGAALPATQAWATQLIVDGVLEAIRQKMSARSGLFFVLPFLALELGLILTSACVSQFRHLLEELIDHRLGYVINTRIIRKALALEVRYFEDSQFYDKMQNARKQSEYRAMAVVNGGFLLVQNFLTLSSFIVFLLAFNPWVALVLFGAAIPAFINQSRYSRLNFRLQTWRAPETRTMSYLEQLLTQDATVKEVKLFGLGEPMLKRHGAIFWKIFNEDARIARERSLKSLGWGLVASFSYYGACAWVIAQTVIQRITLGQMTLYLSMFRQSQGAFQGMLENISRLYESGLFLENLFSFLALPEQKEDRSAAAQTNHSELAQGIEFRNVWFQYPGSLDWAIRDFSLVIQPGEKIALVGENGAGKTTLIKILTRLYEPTRGSVYLNGRDIRDYPMEELRVRIGAIFQDFVKYQLTLGENIGVGSVEHLEEAARIQEASRKGGADQVAAQLPEGYATQLGRWFEDGHELSGGQWQKIALGRAFMREGEVLVLDEPTSALDAAAEYEIFQRFRSLSEGKIALLISHRFSTVRMADRIVVMSGGKIEELGSHAELVARKGTYARLFELQAEGYR